jgi:hypothetical protein
MVVVLMPAMLCYAVLCCAVLCRAVLCRAVLCCAVLCCTDLADDPYRSLAALVRKAGGYTKSSKPFSEVTMKRHAVSQAAHGRQCIAAVVDAHCSLDTVV